MHAAALSALFLAAVANGAAVAPQAGACTSYFIIDTRGTGEPQGPSAGFRTMNDNIRSQVSGVTIYDTQYTADLSQQSSAGTADIVNKVTTTLQSNPSTCFLLEGYSQGAAATVNALPKLTGNAFDAVKGVFLIGNPLRKPDLSCNVDSQGGTSTSGTTGVELRLTASGIPPEWVKKTKDVCAKGDGVCDSSIPGVITNPHLSYPYDTNVQNMGAQFGVNALTNGTSQQHSSDGGSDNGQTPGTEPGPSVLSGGDPQHISYGSDTSGQPMGTHFGTLLSGGTPRRFPFGSGTTDQRMGSPFGSGFPRGGTPGTFPKARMPSSNPWMPSLTPPS